MKFREAILLIERLILEVLKGGGFQDFNTLDAHRNALDTLKKHDPEIEQPAADAAEPVK